MIIYNNYLISCSRIIKNLLLYCDSNENLFIRNLENTQILLTQKSDTFYLNVTHRGLLYTSKNILIYKPLYNIYQKI